MFTMIMIIKPEQNKPIPDRIGLIKHVLLMALLLLLIFPILSSASVLSYNIYNYEYGGIKK